MKDEIKESMLELFIFETRQLLEDLEQEILDSEKSKGLDESIPEIFRTMHTIKGSAALMGYNNVTELTHAVEDLFYFLREEHPKGIDTTTIIDLVLESVDFIKNEINKAERKEAVAGQATELIAAVKAFLGELKAGSGTSKKASTSKKKEPKAVKVTSEPVSAAPQYQAVIKFEKECGFEDLQAFTLINNLKTHLNAIVSEPESFIDDETAIEVIKTQGLKLTFQTELTGDALLEFLKKNAFVANVDLKSLEPETMEADQLEKPKTIILDEPAVVEETLPIGNREKANGSKVNTVNAAKQSLISVSVHKMDVLLDLVGELVISEAMVTRSPELAGLQLDQFSKSALQLRKITDELQDVVMSIRMVPLVATFQKMQRIVRDMKRKLNKEVNLELIGEETEVDKNIIEHISDPLMHLIRNAIDHGIESAAQRKAKHKPEIGTVTLAAKNAGSDVLIEVRDDGKGLNREAILNKAKTNGLLTKPETEMSDREVYSLVLLPGFSTKEKVTEFSGRGVGLDVVAKEIEQVGGTVLINSSVDAGTVFTLKIPLTLAIIDGITIMVGASQYTVPTNSIRESFRVKPQDVIVDPDGNEMILIRGVCYPLVRLHQLFKVENAVEEIAQGVVMMLENNDKGICVLVDHLLGEQQVVVKALPQYIKKVQGISGCTLLGNGSISLIMDVPGLIQLATGS